MKFSDQEHMAEEYWTDMRKINAAHGQAGRDLMGLLKDKIEEVDANEIIGKTKIGTNNRIYPFASIGTDPQDMKYKGEKDKIRLLELDTPEINNSKCEKEYILGIKARDYINKLISNSYKIEFISDYKRDYFGRILTYMFIDGENVSKIIVSNELGVIYDKNNKPNL